MIQEWKMVKNLRIIVGKVRRPKLIEFSFGFDNTENGIVIEFSGMKFHGTFDMRFVGQHELEKNVLSDTRIVRDDSPRMARMTR